jgi:multidrug efflux pump subunit AcrB
MRTTSSNRSGGILAWFTYNPVASNLLFFLVIVMGVLALGDLRKETFPNIPPTMVTISVSYDSGSAKQSEEGLALKIEEALEGVSGIKKVTSISTRRGTTVTVDKESSVDLERLLEDVKIQVDAISTFPSGAENPVVSKQKKQDHALQISVHGHVDRKTLQQAQQQLKKALLRQPAIREIVSSGERNPLILVELDEGKLQAYGLTFSDISQVLNAESLSAVAGEIRGKNRTFSLKAASQAYYYRDFARIPLKTRTDGSQLFLGDIAEITDAHDESESVMARFNGEPALSLELVMDNKSDINKVISQATQLINQWKQTSKFPKSIQITTWYDNSGFISDRLDLMTKNALQGLLIVGVLLSVFLNVRVAFWVAAGVPFCFIGSFIFMGDSFFGLSLNVLTSFGFIMALGIIVDDAIVIGESIYATMQQKGDSIESAIEGTQRVAIPTVFGILTTIAAFYPITQIDGNLGKIFSQFVFIVVITLLLSLVESKLILPAHLAHLKTNHEKSSYWIVRLWQFIQRSADNLLNFFNRKIYQPILRMALNFRYAVIFLFISLFIFTVGLITTGEVSTSFFPEIEGEIITTSFSTVDDIGYGIVIEHLDTLEKSLQQADNQLQKKYALKESIVTAVLAEQLNDNTGSIKVELVADIPVSGGEFTDVWRELTPELEAIKKLEFSSRKLRSDVLRIELLGHDERQLDLAGKLMRSRLKAIQGVKDIDDNLSPGQPQIRLTLTPEGRAKGLSSSDLAKQVQQIFGGEKVQKYQRKNDEVEVKVSYPQENRQSMSDLQASRIRTANGDVLPLMRVANISMGYEKSSITRLDKRSAVIITAAVNKDLISSSEVVAKLQDKTVDEIHQNYYGVEIKFGGEEEEQAETAASMKKIFLISLALIYILLAIPLGSYVQPLLIMLAIPFGIVGAIWGHWFADLSVSILSLIGVMALSGVVVNDSLLLVSHFNRAKQTGLTAFDAVVDAGSKRLRAIFLTSVTTFAGLLPILSETSAQAQFLKPAAASMAFGILFATFITLLLIPMMLKIVDDYVNWINVDELRNVDDITSTH